MHVEDHPLDYASFEGTIPEGNYGAGTVMVWDFGSFEVVSGEAKKALDAGKLVVRLHGTKLEGQWTLVRMRGRGNEKQDPWLLIKTNEDARKIAASLDDTSAQSARAMKQISGNGVPRVRRKSKSSSRVRNSSSPSEVHDASVRFIEPMKARLSTDLPSGKEWLFEVKLDGIRAIALKDGKRVELWSRRPRDLTASYPQIVDALRKLPAETFVSDGEIVALDEKGRSSFQLLQNMKRSGNAPPVFFYLFDLLNFNGRDLRDLPLVERKELLERLLKSSKPPLRFSESLNASADKVWKEVQRLGLEGVIAKRRDSKYEAGRRSGAWQKIKTHNEQEFVIGGYTPPEGSRKNFGSVLVGYYSDSKLMFASGVGAGFTVASLESLYEQFQKLRVAECPFSNLPTPRGGSKGVTPAKMRECVWLKPELVCQVKFLEWTRDGNLRQPVFLGLREDKDPRQVVREAPPPGLTALSTEFAKGGENDMPGRKRLRGVSSKERRMYEHIKKSSQRSGRYGKRAKEVAARTVMKHHRKKGHAKGH